MGGGGWNDDSWKEYVAEATKDRSGREKPREEIFTRRGVKAEFDPKNIKFRESIDSPDNPKSTPVIVALDDTGSMGQIPEALIKDGLGKMATEILLRRPITDPHIMFMAVGDAEYDRAPLQVTQFEADIRIAEQLKDLWLEGGGGANLNESYHLPWYFAARHTIIDSFLKRQKKGFLFSVGDEGVPEVLEAKHIKNVFNDVAQDIPSADLLRMVEERYEVFHLIVQQGHNYRHSPTYVEGRWRSLLGERAILVSDYTRIPEVIVSTLEVMAGKSNAEVAASWSGSTAMVVNSAIKGLTQGGKGRSLSGADGSPGVWRPGKGGPGGMA